MKKLILFIFVVCFGVKLVGQDNYKVLSLGFYNLENLFDYERDTTINDFEFTPYGKRSWTKDRYTEKLSNMAYVISQMGKDIVPYGVSILGVSEIENKRVLEDLVAQDQLKDRNYQIIHRDSPDRRGIDVALLYNPLHFTEISTEMVNMNFIFDDGDTLRTREIMHVKGVLDSDTVHVLVNHWPSRSGGEKRSRPRRNKAAKTVKEIVDGLKADDPNVKVFVIGDLNDDPTSPSVKKILKADGKKSDVDPTEMFNPMFDFYRRGLGSNAYRDNWSLFDQIIMSPGLIQEKTEGYQFYKAQIFNKKYLIQRSGRYKGYPLRTFSFDKYQSGYSDHFPVLVYLIKKV